jgi:hypothetical protein
MIDRQFRFIVLSSIAAALIHPTSVCRADLFALSTGMEILHRIDADTLTITQSYVEPSAFPPPSPPFSGLAFDGRILSWTSDLSGFSELHQFDAFTEQPLPPVPLFEILPPNTIAGLGALGPGLPGLSGPLLGVTRPRLALPEPMPATIYHIDPFGAAYPLGDLPPEYTATGLDIDPATGEIWISARNINEPMAQLLNVSVFDPLQSAPAIRDDDEFAAAAAAAPSIIINSVLTVPLPPLSIRGVGFDEGRMYVLAAVRMLHEIDRTTGQILRSGPLPIDGIFAGLTGGTLVPEPTAWGLAATTLVALLVRRRRT